MSLDESRVTTRPELKSAITLGVGLGGFIDGIVLHQILQWHSMMSNVVPPNTLPAMHFNMFWDGVFHAATWIVTFIGVLMLWRSGMRRTLPPLRMLVGGLLTGWALFNLAEGVINHHWLRLHNVREVSEPLLWNYAFLGISTALLVVGFTLARSGRGSTKRRRELLL